MKIFILPAVKMVNLVDWNADIQYGLNLENNLKGLLYFLMSLVRHKRQLIFHGDGR
jgi:hypothetical protein